jgi:hypothetical protein
MAKAKATGYRVELTMFDGRRIFRNYEVSSIEKLEKKLKTFDIVEVHSIEPHEWEYEYMDVKLNI